jgi:hypothetical protein
MDGKASRFNTEVVPQTIHKKFTIHTSDNSLYDLGAVEIGPPGAVFQA